MPFKIVFSRPPKIGLSTKTLLLKHYYRHQGKCSDLLYIFSSESLRVINSLRSSSANKGLPLPLGRGVCETKSKNGRPKPRKLFISRVFCAERGIETMVSDHGPGRGQTMGWG